MRSLSDAELFALLHFGTADWRSRMRREVLPATLDRLATLGVFERRWSDGHHQYRLTALGLELKRLAAVRS